jgi:hypothetical protein
MIPSHRDRFNQAFTEERYRALTAEVERRARAPLHFRLSETPCFVPRSIADGLVEAAQQLVTQLLGHPDYRRAADDAVPPEFRIPNGEDLPTFVQVDFGLVEGARGFEGRLVELQAFPSLYGFQVALAEAHQHAYGLDGLSPFLSGLDRDGYLRVVGTAILGAHDPREVVLMDLDPVNQKTWPDFEVTRQLWGVESVDASTVVREGRRLYYHGRGGLTRIARIYNRVIPDELHKKGLRLPFDYRDDLDVEWAGGPDWYFRISKFSMPWLRHPWVPFTRYLSDVEDPPADREAWLLKPLFSFAGGGIVFAPGADELAAIPASERHLFVLQERVAFTPVIRTPHGPTHAEIRVMLVRAGDAYQAVTPLIRMGRGKMMGVDYNKGLAWVGASAGFVDTTL